MLNTTEILAHLEREGIRFFTGVPDSLLKELCSCMMDTLLKKNHIIAANEGGAVALAAGHYLATGMPALVYMQNSGQGNAINPLISLADHEVYGIPMLLLVGWRGEPGVKDEPQHIKQGRITCALFDAMEIRYEILSKDVLVAKEQISELVCFIREQKRPAALLVRAGTFTQREAVADRLPLVDTQPERFMRREEAIRRILLYVPENAVIVSTTGHISRELYEIREEHKGEHHRDFLTVGSMGHASQIAMGIALARPDLPVFCIDGDGAAIMHMGALAILAQSGCRNLYHIVLNNGVHGSVGGQPTVGFQIDFCRIAEGGGYVHVGSAHTPEQLEVALERFSNSFGTSFLEIRVGKEHRSTLGRPKTTPAENERALLTFLGVS